MIGGGVVAGIPCNIQHCRREVARVHVGIFQPRKCCGPYAQAAARALLENTDMNARDIAVKALDIAGDICIYTNHNHTIEELPSKA